MKLAIGAEPSNHTDMQTESLRRRGQRSKVVALFSFLCATTFWSTVYDFALFPYSDLEGLDGTGKAFEIGNLVFQSSVAVACGLFVFQHRFGLNFMKWYTLSFALIATAGKAFLIANDLPGAMDTATNVVGLIFIAFLVVVFLRLSDRERLEEYHRGREWLNWVKVRSNWAWPVATFAFAALLVFFGDRIARSASERWGETLRNAIDLAGPVRDALRSE